MVSLASTVAEMSEGEVLQLQRAGRLDGSLDAYYDIIDRKSASLIAWCASAGALTIGDDQAAAALERYGRGVGRAFQITDDVLDYAPGTGKTPGADLRERKLTLPLVYAMERVGGLREELLSGPPSAERVAALVHVIRESGALAAALDDARDHMQDALRALDELPQTPAREALRVLGTYLVERNT
jgi:octaprenyl-diphosphate synthase